ncbi:NYN domain-containing protein [Limnofasciculus baicalensis]|uniref:NYN domain-containing protein n=1 Tax=Limnofasciculus baicalensis BBK-W-15 TaxID=2699891 RepID=A0AAE3GX17_9CYAN|nr:NYN domain-containing protein [Limnofasciculus baicalensis]MCP2732175.1 NYN domain-containing protein [Limnofasciculus baicalensis BBK-W-15]
MSPHPPQTILLVDGYNIIGAWSRLNKTRDRQGLCAARQELVEALINYSAFVGYTTQIVFDAQYQKSQAHQEGFTNFLSVCYTDFGQTADSYIEKFCASFRSQEERQRQRLIVATSDREQRLVVVGYGAEWISSLQLECDVGLTARQVNIKQRSQKQSRSRFLFNSLDPKAQEILAKWRNGGN